MGTILFHPPVPLAPGRVLGPGQSPLPDRLLRSLQQRGRTKGPSPGAEACLKKEEHFLSTGPKGWMSLPSFSHRSHCRDAGRDSCIGFPPGCLNARLQLEQNDLAFVQHLWDLLTNIGIVGVHPDKYLVWISKAGKLMLVMRFLPLLCPSLLSCLSNGILKWTSVTLKSFLRILLNSELRASPLLSPPNLRSQGRYPGT